MVSNGKGEMFIVFSRQDPFVYVDSETGDLAEAMRLARILGATVMPSESFHRVYKNVRTEAHHNGPYEVTT